MSMQITIVGDLALIAMNRGCTAKVDAVDLPLVIGHTWTTLHSLRTAYARRTMCVDGKQKTILLHRVILAAEDGIQVDHINGDGLDCRRGNLRLATQQQNNCNTRRRIDNKTGFKGVRKHTLCSKYTSDITIFGRKHYLGLFDTPEAAYAAYCAASALHHKEFGRTT